jgi:dinuclear metal center YbgI/SA1388 family protein
MMPKVQDICNLLEEFAPLSYQEPYDNAGLTIGKREMILTGVMVCLDVSEPVIDEALELGCNMIVSHHPLIFRGIKSLTGFGRIDECIVKAIKNDIAIYSGHTNVDSVLNGVNGKISEKLGLKNVRFLAPKSSDEFSGMGILGDLETENVEIEFLKRFKDIFGCKTIQHSAMTGKPVKRVAICGGSGSEFIKNAIDSGATVFITGEAKFHEFFTEGTGIMLVVAGHYETEQFTKELFLELISKKFPKFAVHVSTVEKNPINYL